jgi:hypothetical protein
MDSLAQLEDAANSGSETTYLKTNWTDEYLGKLSLEAFYSTLNNQFCCTLEQIRKKGKITFH